VRIPPNCCPRFLSLWTPDRARHRLGWRLPRYQPMGEHSSLGHVGSPCYASSTDEGRRLNEVVEAKERERIVVTDVIQLQRILFASSGRRLPGRPFLSLKTPAAIASGNVRPVTDVRLPGSAALRSPRSAPPIRPTNRGHDRFVSMEIAIEAIREGRRLYVKPRPRELSTPLSVRWPSEAPLSWVNSARRRRYAPWGPSRAAPAMWTLQDRRAAAHGSTLLSGRAGKIDAHPHQHTPVATVFVAVDCAHGESLSETNCSHMRGRSGASRSAGVRGATGPLLDDRDITPHEPSPACLQENEKARRVRSGSIDVHHAATIRPGREVNRTFRQSLYRSNWDIHLPRLRLRTEIPAWPTFLRLQSRHGKPVVASPRTPDSYVSSPVRATSVDGKTSAHPWRFRTGEVLTPECICG